jgi:hypothetical protein
MKEAAKYPVENIRHGIEQSIFNSNSLVRSAYALMRIRETIRPDPLGSQQRLTIYKVLSHIS